MEQECCCQEAGLERRDLCARGGMASWHGSLSEWVSQVGGQQPPMFLPLTGNVCTCEGSRAERIWVGHLLRLPATSSWLDTEAEVPAVQLIRFKTMRWNLGTLQWSLSTQKVTEPLTMYPRGGRGLALEILSSLKEHLSQRQGSTQPEEQGLTSTLRSDHQAELSEDISEGWWLCPHQSQGGPLAGAGSCSLTGREDWKVKLVS